MGSIHNKSSLTAVRRQLRKSLTPAEAMLWKALQRSQLQGRKFRRQHSIENFVVDFYCPAEKLIIELDGEFHNMPSNRLHDFDRDRRLQELGYTVVRIENKHVFESLAGVLGYIAAHFKRG
jgi:very-short-patch-repair endonuclease